MDSLGVMKSALEDVNLVAFSDLLEKGWDFLNNPAKGYETPWKKVGNLFKFVPGELTLLSGYTGQGKSEIVCAMALNSVYQGAKAMIASLEMSGGQIHARMVRQATGCVDFTREHYEAVSNFYTDKIHIFDTRGVADIKKILQGGRLLNQAYNYDFFVFDNLMMLDSKADDYNRQLDNVQRMVEFAKTFNVCVVLVAHSRKPSNKESDGRYVRDFSPPGIYEVMGASGVANLVDNHLSITINQKKLRALDAVRNSDGKLTLKDVDPEILSEGDALLKRDKKREHGDYFVKYLYYDKRFRLLKDYENEVLKPYFYYQKT